MPEPNLTYPRAHLTGRPAAAGRLRAHTHTSRSAHPWPGQQEDNHDHT
jgi:hypothetical protein